MVVLEARYLHATPEGKETPTDMLWRVARAVAEPEARYGEEPQPWAERYYRLMASRRFLPNSPTIGNAGRPKGQLSACFVLPVDDSLDAIFDGVKNAARIHGTGGGTGFSFSRLRPADAPLRDGVGTASGPVAFMRVFDAATGAVKQGGVRRGANMGILRVDHPDVREFVRAKDQVGELTHFNISVAATQAFMEALAADRDFALINPVDQSEAGRLSARALWDELVNSAWSTGDPGLVFIDRINDLAPTPQLGPIESTNPCGELPLLPYESCNLGSVNLAEHLLPAAPGEVPELDWESLADTIRVGVRFLDDVIDANTYPLEDIARVTRQTRKIGLGVMGWADLLAALQIPYASEDALELADRASRFLLETAREASRQLAASRGAFPAWEGSRWDLEGVPGPLRNSTTTTVAPTGTISILAGCSSGIEPLYALAYQRTALDGKELLRFTHPGFEAAARQRGCWTEALAGALLEHGDLSALPPELAATLPAELRATWATAHEIAPEWHVRHQAAWQLHIENAVSKTVNLPRDASPADVDRVYRLAYELGCKGITVYRDGSREGQVLSHPAGAGPACGGPECAEPGL
jgi:ribonucleoside-diphosphate reductase alpha chain